MHPLAIVILGPAGSGKTRLAKSLGEWIEKNLGKKVGYINLDPAVEVLPYVPDFDARKLVSAKDLMLKGGLGPNGAIVKSVDMLASKGLDIARELSNIKGEVLIADTPGQVETFLFRPAGPSLIRTIKQAAPTIAVYLTDPTLGLGEAEAAVAILMSLIIQLRLDVPTVPAISKADLLTVARGNTTHVELHKIKEKLLREGKGILAEVCASILDLVGDYVVPSRIVMVSSMTGYGLEDLYKLIHETFCTCGDLT